jgi:succinate-semialdehyde dehydrogenase/glutarate-semialdehyde dehydrogenase
MSTHSAPAENVFPTHQPQLFGVIDPATLEEVGTVPDQGAEEAVRAVHAAHEAFPAWAATAPRARSEVLGRAAVLMRGARRTLSELITAESGKPLSDSDAEVEYAAEFFRWYAEEAVRHEGEFRTAPSGASRTIVTHKPVGVAALITPWNFPAAMITRKVAPALAAGCAVVVKPAAETPLTALAIEELLLEAGVPRGLVNVVTTSDPATVVDTWLRDPRVRKVSFTGSTRVGKQLLKSAADGVLNASMELGGNAPFVVTHDADVASAVEGAMRAKFRNSAQACTAANRFFVHAAVADTFVQQFGEAIESLRVGEGAAEGTDVGPLISRAAVTRIGSAVDAAVASGARVTHQAAVPDLPGHFYPPTLVVDVAPDAELVTQEIFGPVAPVITWDDEKELLELINQSDHGLASYVYAGDLRRAMRLAEGMESGMVGINRGYVSEPSAPFGGVKQSGLGREGSREGLREFQETQYWSLDWQSD